MSIGKAIRLGADYQPQHRKDGHHSHGPRHQHRAGRRAHRLESHGQCRCRRRSQRYCEHKGLVETGHRGSGKDVGLILHLSASTSLAPDPNSKTLVCTIEEAIELGADAVSIHINIGAEDERRMLHDFGAVSREARRWGMPLLAMMYTRGPKIASQYDPALVKHAARVGAELGADIVKVPYTGSPDTFFEVVEGCFVPVVIAGGEKMDTDEDILKMVRGAMEAGGAGISIGRNVFQHHDPTRIVRAMSGIVHNGMGLDESLTIVRNSGKHCVKETEK